MTKELEIVRPDDWHLHLRDGTILKSVLPYTSKIFGRSIIMPNLIPPITTVQDATMYKDRIIEALPNDHSFRPLMTLYLTETTDVMDLAEGHTIALSYLLKESPQIISFNLGTGMGTSVLELINTFEKVNKVSIPYIIGKRRDGDLPNVIADNTKSKRILNWTPKRNIEDMCIDGWNWQLKNPEGYC